MRGLGCSPALAATLALSDFSADFVSALSGTGGPGTFDWAGEEGWIAESADNRPPARRSPTSARPDSSRRRRSTGVSTRPDGCAVSGNACAVARPAAVGAALSIVGRPEALHGRLGVTHPDAGRSMLARRLEAETGSFPRVCEALMPRFRFGPRWRGTWRGVALARLRQRR